MKIDVRHIAKLARIRIDEDKLDQFEKDMNSVISIAERFPEIDDLTLPEAENAMLLREDKVAASELTREELLSNAPETRSGCFAVPKTVE